jgi:hypothetical protein
MDCTTARIDANYSRQNNCIKRIAAVLSFHVNGTASVVMRISRQRGMRTSLQQVEYILLQQHIVSCIIYSPIRRYRMV